MKHRILSLKHKNYSNPVFDEFIESGYEESISPFLTPSSRRYARLLPLKAAIVAAALLLIAFVFSFFPNLLPLTHLLLVLVYFIAGVPSLIESIQDLLKWEINIDVLMTLAAFLSVVIGSGMEGALLLVLFSLSGSIEEAVTSRAKGAISSLKKLSPPTANVVTEDGSLIERSVRDITVGTHILVKAGDFIPLDGIVKDGVSSVNLVHLTGENLPVVKQVGDQIPAGGRNIEGTLTIEVTHSSQDSTLTRLIELITQAQEARPKLQRWVDKVTNRYALCIIAIAFIFAIGLPFVTNIPYLGVEGALYRALAFLVAASPCAIVIAIPIAYLSAVGSCARKGILLKGGIILDSLARCKVLSFDKTGTLTTGQLNLIRNESFDPTQEQIPETLSIAIGMERGAKHPIATALLSYGQMNNIAPYPIKEFKVLPGYGLEGTIDIRGKSHFVYIGRPEKIYERLNENDQKKLKSKCDHIEAEGKLIAVMAIGTNITLFQFQDTIRQDMRPILDHLKKRFRLIMLTGDHSNSAQQVANALGITEYYADLKPQDKLDKVSLLSQTEGLAMIGDGINDAPALARATVGISMGKVGSSTAIDASDIVLLHDNLGLLDWLMNKAKKTQQIVKQNVAIAAAVILLSTTPALYGWIPLWLAVLLHEGGTVLVGLNGLRLLRKN
ncbi:MAG: heavy metal translocating P-type ATPase [Parachlamydiales bacterium]|nr:heavy metal translocating P-type ATPase [Parachlamydiales bacterium]